MSRAPLSKRVAIACATIHLLAFLATVAYVYSSADPQASLAWGFWAVIDFLLSLLYLLAGQSYSTMLQGLSGHAEALVHVLYFPHLVHGLLGTVWWYILPFLVTSRRLGGVWGRRADKPAASTMR